MLLAISRPCVLCRNGSESKLVTGDVKHDSFSVLSSASSESHKSRKLVSENLFDNHNNWELRYGIKKSCGQVSWKKNEKTPRVPPAAGCCVSETWQILFKLLT